MAEQMIINGLRVVETFDVPLPMKKKDGEPRYYHGYEGVVLEDGTRLMRCLEPGCEWTNPADRSPGGHQRSHRIDASQALRGVSVGQLVDALTENRALRREMEVLQARLKDKDLQHKQDMKNVRAVAREGSENWRKRALRAEKVLSALSGYQTPSD